MPEDILPQEQVASLVEDLKNATYLDERVMAVLARSGLMDFPASPQRIQIAFAKIRESHRDLFKELTFSQGDKYPFSRELESVLFRLEMSGFMSLKNPTYEIYELAEDAKQLVEDEIEPKLTSKEQNLIADASELFRKEMRLPQPTLM